MFSWISRRPVLLVGLLAWATAWQFLRAATGWIVLFPTRRAERLFGKAVFELLEAVASGKPVPEAWRSHNPDIDLSQYAA
jgi:hypothetical protein